MTMPMMHFRIIQPMERQRLTGRNLAHASASCLSKA
jgi:hypothetical protein